MAQAKKRKRTPSSPQAFQGIVIKIRGHSFRIRFERFSARQPVQMREDEKGKTHWLSINMAAPAYKKAEETHQLPEMLAMSIALEFVRFRQRSVELSPQVVASDEITAEACEIFTEVLPMLKN